MSKRLYYEIHVTVKTNDITRFIKECKAADIKPIVLNLQRLNSSDVIQDVMTSSKISGEDKDTFNELYRVSALLQRKGFDVVRKKVETVPWHPKAIIHDENSKTGYFEAHIPIIVSKHKVSELSTITQNLTLHLSRNPFKGLNDELFVQMLTLRNSCKPELFKTQFNQALHSLSNCGFYPMKPPEIEYALYDSNVQHDYNWLSQ